MEDISKIKENSLQFVANVDGKEYKITLDIGDEHNKTKNVGFLVDVIARKMKHNLGCN